MKLSQPIHAKLVAMARQAASHAHCPYSDFPVGAAVLTARAEVFLGCDVENASHGLTGCAERNAIFQAVAQGDGPLVIQAIAVFTPATLLDRRICVNPTRL